jgi:adenosylcobyric acid synthase
LETPQGAVTYRDGALNAEGTVLGTYMHGLFHNFGFRQALLANLRRRWGLEQRGAGNLAGRETQYERLAALVRRSLDMAAVYRILEEGIDG